MNESEKKRSGAIALALCLGGLLLALSIGMIAKLLGHDARMPAYLVFLSFQIAGFVMGIASRQEVLGKTAYITSAVLALGSTLLIG
jgi:uncharacterized membrane protein AbrB (regulator of aidB expression)